MSGLNRRVTICNERGLHARAAAKFVNLAADFEADILVSKCSDAHPDRGQKVSGRSILGLMMLAAEPGAELEISASGGDAEAALAALVKLVESRFNEAC